MDPLSIAASVAGLLQAVAATCKAVKTIKNLPKAFEHVDKHLPLVQRTLNDVQTRLNHRVLADEERQSINKILEDCLVNAQHLKQVFVAIEQKCNKDKDSRTWGELRGWYNTTLRGTKGYRVESLMTDILKDLKQLSLYESFALATREDIEEIKKALDELSQVESSMEDTGNNQGTSVSNSQNVAIGGHGQQNTPLGGHNTFNSGYNISGGHVNIDQSFAHTLIPAGIPHPQGAIKRIRAQKGKVLKVCYEWILSNDDFKRWRDGDNGRLLWIRGDPGKGKTMLLCGITETFEDMKSRDSQARIPIYFFCQATDDQLNTAESVMQGLLAFLIEKSAYSRDKYLDSDRPYRADWDILVQKVEDVLRDLNKEGVYLIVDALDECINGREKLLKAIVELSESTLQGVKILVSSRNLTDIEDELSCAELTIDLSLERNKPSVGDAIGFFIADQITALAKRKRYSEDLREEIREYLESNSRGTFLWVALVCKELAKCKLVDSAYEMLKSNFPPELNRVYARMVESINQSSENPGLCKQILAIACAVYRPVNWREMKSLLDNTTRNNLSSVIGLCGSFLSIQEDDGTKDDDKIIVFVHLSAKDFLLENQDVWRQIMPHGLVQQHYYISKKSIKNLSAVLKRDLYDLQHPGYPIEKVSTPEPDPLASVRYSCVYWPSHILEIEHSGASAMASELDNDTLPPESSAKILKDMIMDAGIIHRFIEQKYLFWLEALSLLSEIAEGVKAMQRLESSLRNREAQELYQLVKDAWRFILSFHRGIEIAPLQVYASALIFSPTNSLIRTIFDHEYPSWMEARPTVKNNWDACLQAIKVPNADEHRSEQFFVAFSSDNRQLIAKNGYGDVMALDATTGKQIRTLQEGCRDFSPIALSTDGKHMISTTESMINLCDISSSECTQIMEAHSGTVTSVCFSHCCQKIAIAYAYQVIEIWRLPSEECTYTLGDLQNQCTLTLPGEAEYVWAITFSSSDQHLLFTTDLGVCIYDIHSETCVITIKHDLGLPVAFSSNGQQVVSKLNHDVKIWDATAGCCTQTLQGHKEHIRALTFSKDGERVASYSLDTTIRIWDSICGVCLHIFENSRDSTIVSLDFSNDGQRVASGSESCEIMIWDMDAVPNEGNQIERNNHAMRYLGQSKNGQRVASESAGHTIEVWDTISGNCIQTLCGHNGRISELAWSHHTQQVVSISVDDTLRLWDATSGNCLHTFAVTYRSGTYGQIAWSGDDRRVAWEYISQLKVWDVTSGECLFIRNVQPGEITGLALSNNGQLVATILSDYDSDEVRVWDVNSGACILAHKNVPGYPHRLVLSSNGQLLAAIYHTYHSNGGEIRVWDINSGRCVLTRDHIPGYPGGLALSNDGELVAASFKDDEEYTVREWNVHSEICTRTIRTMYPVESLSFDTEVPGWLNWDEGYSGHGLSIGLDLEWLVYDGKHLIWLPPEYRPENPEYSFTPSAEGAGPRICVHCSLGQFYIVGIAAGELVYGH